MNERNHHSSRGKLVGAEARACERRRGTACQPTRRHVVLTLDENSPKEHGTV